MQLVKVVIASALVLATCAEELPEGELQHLVLPVL